MTDTETVAEVYAAINRNDIPAAVKAFDPGIEWTDPVDSPLGGSHHGREAVQEHFSRARANWAEGSCEPERFIVAGDKVVALVHVRVRLKDELEWREGDLADVYTFRDGKVTEGRSFADRRQGLEWAGVKD